MSTSQVSRRTLAKGTAADPSPCPECAPQPTAAPPHPGRSIKGFWVCDAHDLAECPWCSPARQQDGGA